MATRIYPLSTEVPEPMDISELIPQVSAQTQLAFKFCRPQCDILVCYVPNAPQFTWIHFTLLDSSPKRWQLSRVNVSTLQEIGQDNLRVPAGHSNSIYCITQRFIISTAGELFDLELLEHDTEIPGGRVARPALYARNFRVLAIHEYATHNRTVISVVAKVGGGALQFWMHTLRGRRRLHASFAAVIPNMNTVRVLTFSPDGMSLFVTPFIADTEGWIIMFCASAFELIPRGRVNEECDFKIVKVPKLYPTLSAADDDTHGIEYLALPEFVARDIVIIQEHKSPMTSQDDRSVIDYRSVRRECLVVRFSERKAVIDKVRIADILSVGQPVLADSPESIQQRTRYYYKRWLNVLLEKPRTTEFCRSVSWVGERCALSPSGEFLVYVTARIPEVNAISHAELCDLTLPSQRGHNVRRSLTSFLYCLRKRPHYG